MGISGKKTTTTNKPVYASEITGAANTLTNTYNQQAPKIQGYADQIGALVPSLVDRYTQGDPAINAARSYVTDTLAGDPAQNPYLDDMVALTGDNVRNQTQAAMGTRGQTGGSAYADLISRNLANNETGLRYTDYNNEQQRRAQAAGMAPGVVAGDLMTLAPAMSAAEFASMLPMNAAGQYAAGTGGLLGAYGTQTTKQSNGLMGALGMGLQAASIFSDERLKEDVERVGETDGGLGVYKYRYKGDPTPHMGVMAQEVEKKQPKASGPRVGGYRTVNYGEVR